MKSDKPLTPRERQRRDFMRKQRASSEGQKSRQRGPRDDDRARDSGPAGYPVRALAVRLVSAVLDRHRALDDAIAAEFAKPAARDMQPRDRALARLIASTVLRRKGELEAIVSRFIERPLPDDRGLLMPILWCAAAQLVHLEIAPHAVLNIAVEQCRHDRGARRFDKLANAVLRRVSEQGRAIRDTLPGPEINIPAWIWERWVAAYGRDTARRIAAASLEEAPLDLTLADASPANAAAWAECLGGVALPNGGLRLSSHEGRIDELPGFGDGTWWVQDAAASLPARLMGDVAGRNVVDYCAAPGGKSAQLAARGARVTCVDVSPERLDRVRENFARLHLQAEFVTADSETWRPPLPVTHALLDAPCSATGTIRRHPDILHLKRETDIAKLAALQARMLDRVFADLAPGGTLIYCTCSLEPEEGEQQIAKFLDRTSSARREPFAPADLDPVSSQWPMVSQWIDPRGDVRTLPFHAPGEAAPAGMDGFYVARLRKTS